MLRTTASNRISGFWRVAEQLRAFSLRYGWDGVNLAIPSFMLLYAAMAGLLCFWLGRSADFRPTLYFMPFFSSYVIGVSIVGVVVGVRYVFGRSERPFLFFPRVWRPELLISRLISSAPFLIAWPVFMSGFTAVKTLLNDIVPFTWDNRFMEMGKVLHFGQHAWQWLDIENPAVTRLLESAYAFWGVLLVAVPFAIALRRPDCPARSRFLISTVLVFILLGNLAAGMFMSAGPFWFTLNGARHNDYAALFAYLVQADPDGNFSAIAFQRYLWRAYMLGTTHLGTGISAFPSIHVAVATLYALYARGLGRWPSVAAFIYLAVIMIGAVHLGWHYAIDCYAGFLGATFIYGVVGAVQRLRLRVTLPETEAAPA